MNDTLKIYDYKDNLFDTKIPLSEIEEIDVTIISGDEIVSVTTTSGNVRTFDAALLAKNPRMMSFYDGSYVVNKEKIPEWINRTDSYDWRLR